MTSGIAPVLRAGLVFSCACLFAAAAAADGPYVELRGGPSFFADSDRDRPGDLVYEDAGFNVGGAVGGRFADVARGEFAIHYSRSDTDELDVTGPNPPVSGDMGVFSAMGNAYLDADFWDLPVVPYVGFGIGLGIVLADFRVGPTHVDDEEAVFAYNAMAGVSFEVSENWVASTGYRYLGTTDANIRGVDVEMDLHEWVFGVRYEF